MSKKSKRLQPRLPITLSWSSRFVQSSRKYSILTIYSDNFCLVISTGFYICQSTCQLPFCVEKGFFINIRKCYYLENKKIPQLYTLNSILSQKSIVSTVSTSVSEADSRGSNPLALAYSNFLEGPKNWMVLTVDKTWCFYLILLR